MQVKVFVIVMRSETDAFGFCSECCGVYTTLNRAVKRLNDEYSRRLKEIESEHPSEIISSVLAKDYAQIDIGEIDYYRWEISREALEITAKVKKGTKYKVKVK